MHPRAPPAPAPLEILIIFSYSINNRYFFVYKNSAVGELAGFSRAEIIILCSCNCWEMAKFLVPVLCLLVESLDEGEGRLLAVG